MIISVPGFKSLKSETLERKVSQSIFKSFVICYYLMNLGKHFDVYVAHKLLLSINVASCTPRIY